jgi:glycyl-tRNA synthetase beta chain
VPDLLVEVGCEELPAGHCRAALAQLPGLLTDALAAAGLPASGPVEVDVTPRRLAMRAGVPAERPGRRREVRGPRADAPEAARAGFARKHGVDPSGLEERDAALWAVVDEASAPAATLLPDAVAATVAGLELGRSMRWPGGRFSRPIRWLVVKLDAGVVPMELAGVRSGGTSRGHRTLGSPAEIGSAATYRDDLRRVHVVVDPDERRETIVAALDAAGGWFDPMGKLDEVVHLVEWPVVLEGRFPDSYLELPDRIPVTAMQSHQRYFPVRDGAGALQPRFLVVANGGDSDTVRAGNEEVLVGRLEDAAFAVRRDRARGLRAMAAELDRVAFLEGSGSLADKTARVAAAAERLGERNGLPGDVRAAAAAAAALCKADLVSRLVGEFSNLEGYAGSVYAAEAGEPAEVCAAIEEHHRPVEAGAALPETPAGALLAAADKADTLQVAFAAGLEPTGSRDPFGLRRAAAGLAGILLASEWRADPAALIGEAGASFLLDRLEPMLLEESVTVEEVRAARGSGRTEPVEVAALARALRDFRGPGRDAVRDAYGRCVRIAGTTPPGAVDAALLTDAAERDLAAALERLEPGLDAAAALVPAVDRFFEDVLVMAEDEAVRANRLTLVARVAAALRELGDLGELPG